MSWARIKSRASWLGWLLRYWALDKYARPALIAACVFAASAGVGLVATPAEYERAWIWWVVGLLLAAVLIAALVPKAQPPEPEKGQKPETKDGRALREFFGTVWVDDPTVVGWKNGTPEPIRKKGGKK